MRGHEWGCDCEHSRHWSRADVARLETLFGHVDDEIIAERLGRTIEGLRIKAKRLGLTKRDAGMSARDLAALLGADTSTIATTWIRGGLLRAKRGHRSGRLRVWIIAEADVETFIRDHGQYVDAHKVPEDSPFHDLVNADPWLSLPEVHRLTGRQNLNLELTAGTLPGAKRGTHWYIRRSEVAKVRRLPRHVAEESWWRRQNALLVRRNRRKGIAA